MLQENKWVGWVGTREQVGWAGAATREQGRVGMSHVLSIRQKKEQQRGPSKSNRWPIQNPNSNHLFAMEETQTQKQ